MSSKKSWSVGMPIYHGVVDVAWFAPPRTRFPISSFETLVGSTLFQVRAARTVLNHLSILVQNATSTSAELSKVRSGWELGEEERGASKMAQQIGITFYSRSHLWDFHRGNIDKLPREFSNAEWMCSAIVRELWRWDCETQGGLREVTAISMPSWSRFTTQ